MIELTWWHLLPVAIVLTPIVLGFMYAHSVDYTGEDPLGVVDDGDNNE